MSVSRLRTHRMRRRSFLIGCGVALAGCAGGSTETPTPTRTPSPTAAQRRSTPGGSRASFAAYLEARGVAVSSLERTEGLVTLRYEPAGEDYDQLSNEIGEIAGGFLREVEEGWGVDRLEATIVRADGTAVARWQVRSAWLDAYREGEITGRELSFRVIDSLERVEPTPT